MTAVPLSRRLVVMGEDAAAVAAEVGRRRSAAGSDDIRVAGFVGDDEREARVMGEELFGGVDEVVRLEMAEGVDPPVK